MSKNPEARDAEQAKPAERAEARGTEPADGASVVKRAGAGTKGPPRLKDGAGNGIRTRDFDLGKVALYH